MQEMISKKIIKSDDYEVLTPAGWSDFDGVIITKEQRLHIITLSDGITISATPDHLLLTDMGTLPVSNLKIGDLVDCVSGLHRVESISIDDVLSDVYDLINVKKDSLYYTDGVVSHNCSLLMLDELAFVPKRIQEEMWTSLAPTLSTGGSCIVSSTPNGDDDLFAELWRSAEFGNTETAPTDGNGFKAVKVEWDEHPERDESYRLKMSKKIGALKWRQEYECVSGDSMLRVEVDGVERQISMEDAYTRDTADHATIKVKTPTGYRNFSGIRMIEKDRYAKVVFSNGSILKCSLDHRVISNDGRELLARALLPNQKCIGKSGVLTVVSICVMYECIKLYDLMDVENGNVYYTNDILSHNCEFLSSDPLLISSLRLQTLKAVEPKYTDNGFAFWKDINPTAQYYVSSDVAHGIDGDYSTIEVFEWPTLEQVAELRSNKIDTNQLYSAYKWIFAKISEVRNPQSNLPPDIFWSYESNAVGAAITTLYLNDENFPDNVTLVSDAPDRYGMYTSSKKALVALEFKKLVEKRNGGIIIYSDLLIRELKNYIKVGASFAAKQGATDDLVSACLVLTKMLQKASEYDSEVFSKFFEYNAEWNDEDGDGAGAPMLVVV